MAKLTLADLDVAHKRVLVRVDFNVPLDEAARITDDTRITASLATIRAILDRGGRAILMSHLGRPNGKPKREFSLAPVAARLSELIGLPVPLAADCIGPEAERAVAALSDGNILLLENLRFHKEEEANDPAFAKALAALGDCYVNDAFGTAHRAHASTEGITHFISQCAAGMLMEKELRYLGAAVGNPDRPYVVVLGGAKISGKLEVITHLRSLCDEILIGGGMMFTFYKSRGLEIGKSILEEDRLPLAAELERSPSGAPIVLPTDTVAATAFAADAPSSVVSVDAIPADRMGMDIGPATVADFRARILAAKTIVWNGPMGVFELSPFGAGTKAVAEAMVEATRLGATTIVGGGDSAAAVAQLGLSDGFSHVSTGGGASLEFLEGKILPGVAALTERTH
jgi:phosphoglycerate kinase